MKSNLEEKIKKLLRLARSSNPHEAERAMQLAAELARKHRLSLEELNLEKDLEPIAEKAFQVGNRISYEHKMAMGVIDSYFNVRSIISRPKILIFGTETEIVIAEYVLEFLVSSCRFNLAIFQKKERKNRRVWNLTKRANFIRGFFYGIHHTLNAAEEALASDSVTSISLHKDRMDAFIEKRFKGALVKVRTPKTKRSTSAIEQGWNTGKSTNIRTPISHNHSGYLEE